MSSTVTAAVAAHGLATTLRLPDAPLDDDAFDRMLGACQHHRVLGLLGVAVRDGAFPVTPSQHEAVGEQWDAWLAHALRLERLLLDFLELLAAHEVRGIVLKGAALAHAVYADPAMRVFGDLDVLVEPHDFTRAANLAIAAMDGVRGLPELRPGFDDRFGKEILVRVGALELDLHRTFVDGALGQTIDLPSLFHDPVELEVAGHRLLRLGETALILHTAYTAAFGDWPPRLGSMRDFAQVALAPETVPSNLLPTAEAWHACAVVARATDEAVAVLGFDGRSALVDWAASYEPTRLERALVEAHIGPGRGYSRHLAALAVVPGVRARMAYLRGIAFPDRGYLSARGMPRRRLAQAALERVGRRPG